jgi:uncharacterized protein (UPF0332 family)
MKEAEDDFKRGNYDKAISASYFAVRMLAEIFLKDLNRKDDKIANALGRALNESVRRDFMYLFEKRKEADHRDKIFRMDEAWDILNRARKLSK